MRYPGLVRWVLPVLLVSSCVQTAEIELPEGVLNGSTVLLAIKPPMGEWRFSSFELDRPHQTLALEHETLVAIFTYRDTIEELQLPRVGQQTKGGRAPPPLYHEAFSGSISAGEQRWVRMLEPDVSALGIRLPAFDFYRCAEGTPSGCLVDRGLPVCAIPCPTQDAPAPPTPPEPPTLPCPEDAASEDGLVCTERITKLVDCPDLQMQQFGAGCSDIGESCPLNDWPAVSEPGRVVYVQPNATGVGTETDPFGSIEQALTASAAGTLVIVLSAGDHAGAHLSRNATVVGACVERTRVGAVHVEAGSVRLSNLSIAKAHVDRAAALSLIDVVVGDTMALGQLSMRDTLVRAEQTGIIVAGTAWIERTTVIGGARGIECRESCRLTAMGTIVQQSTGFGIHSRGSLTLTRSTVADTSHGLSLAATATLSEVFVRRTNNHNITIHRGRMHFSRVWVDGNSSHGIVVRPGVAASQVFLSDIVLQGVGTGLYAVDNASVHASRMAADVVENGVFIEEVDGIGWPEHQFADLWIRAVTSTVGTGVAVTHGDVKIERGRFEGGAIGFRSQNRVTVEASDLIATRIGRSGLALGVTETVQVDRILVEDQVPTTRRDWTNAGIYLWSTTRFDIQEASVKNISRTGFTAADTVEGTLSRFLLENNPVGIELISARAKAELGTVVGDVGARLVGEEVSLDDILLQVDYSGSNIFE